VNDPRAVPDGKILLWWAEWGGGRAGQ
jgi:hypothetical protein